MSHRLAARYTTAKHAITERLDSVKKDERGLAMAEYLLLLGGVVLVFGLLYAAYQAFASRKIGILNGA